MWFCFLKVADSIYGPEDLGKHSSSNEEDDDDIEKQIQKEVENLKDKKERRFNSLFSGAKNVIFIRCNDEIDPSLLVHRLLCNARDTQVQKTRYRIEVVLIDIKHKLHVQWNLSNEATLY